MFKCLSNQSQRQNHKKIEVRSPPFTHHASVLSFLSSALVKGAGHSVQFRQLQLYRHEMQHFVKVIQGYIANQILQVSWSEFTAKLATAGDPDAIHRMHADYLNRAIFR